MICLILQFRTNWNCVCVTVCFIVRVALCLLAFKTAHGYICNTKQLINDWQCQRTFVDDAVLIPKLNHKTALHHDGPVNPASSGKQANGLSASEIFLILNHLCILNPQRWTVYTVSISALHTQWSSLYNKACCFYKRGKIRFLWNYCYQTVYLYQQASN